MPAGRLALPVGDYRGPVAEQLSDCDDRRLAGYRGLNEGRRRDRWERGNHLFVVEGVLALEQLLASDYEVDSVLIKGNRLSRVEDLIAAAGRPSIPVLVANAELIQSVAGFDVHRGVLAQGRRRQLPEPAQLLKSVPMQRPVVVVEGVNDHENLGAIFRNASAFGAGAVLSDPTTCDPLYRRSIRVSLGHVLRVPFSRCASWPEDLSAIRASGRIVVALTPAGEETIASAAAQLDGASIALVAGAEGPGLSEGALAGADLRVRIPMASGVDSLNVATAVAVALSRLA